MVSWLNQPEWLLEYHILYHKTLLIALNIKGHGVDSTRLMLALLTIPAQKFIDKRKMLLATQVRRLTRSKLT